MSPYPRITPTTDHTGEVVRLTVALAADDVRGLTAAQLAALLAAPAPPDPAPLSTAEREGYERDIAERDLFIAEWRDLAREAATVSDAALRELAAIRALLAAATDGAGQPLIDLVRGVLLEAERRAAQGGRP